MSNPIKPPVLKEIVQAAEETPRSNSLFDIVTAGSDYFVADADKEREKAKKETMNNINSEIERRKSAYDFI